MEHDGFGSRLTSTPYEKTFPDASGRSTFRPSNLYESFDTGYHTGAPSCSTQSFLEFGIADDVSMLPKRPSYRGIRRVDIIAALLDFDRTNYLVERIISYLPFCDRITMLAVSTRWNSLQSVLPHCFKRDLLFSNDPNEKENYKLVHCRRLMNQRIPLSGLNSMNLPCRTMKSPITNGNPTPEELHICPVCSGPAYHRASEWPNRLHCQSVTCGLSVCFVCHREHSPSETCPIREPRPVLRMPSPESEPVRGRLKRKLNKLALRRL
ncbi:hypothetical protein CSKR_113013 [Clonorchis sinensis]|uniref:F-box domain-containing protein n=2 Tax=Clonorchis sinensis TaxID=79923 RepID=A0A8T1LWL1_CLOSI|nr:hypothetical protein CSKR_113013 [Clonorchis sinensis]